MIRFGLVCEGATDFITAANFLETSLAEREIDAEFIDLQPGLDKTSEKNCGWANALLWLKKNSLNHRKVSILGRGLFSGRLGSKKCDSIIIILDSDCMSDVGFVNFCEKHIDPFPKGVSGANAVLFAIERFSELSYDEAASERHILCVALHNSESWCVAVLPDDPARKVETISVEDTNKLVLEALSAFPSASLIDESRRLKDRGLRDEFCKANLQNVNRLESRSDSFNKLVADATEVSAL